MPKTGENPYVVIRRDGIEVIAKGLASGRKTVVAADLEQRAQPNNRMEDRDHVDCISATGAILVDKEALGM